MFSFQSSFVFKEQNIRAHLFFLLQHIQDLGDNARVDWCWVVNKSRCITGDSPKSPSLSIFSFWAHSLSFLSPLTIALLFIVIVTIALLVIHPNAMLIVNIIQTVTNLTIGHLTRNK